MHLDADFRSLVEKGMLPEDEAFMSLFSEAVKIPNTFLSVCKPVERRIEYITKSVTNLVGYQPQDYIEGGFEFLFSVTSPETIPGVLNALRQYVDDLKKPGFDPRKNIIYEFLSDTITPGKKLVRTISMSIAISYTSDADANHIIALISEDREQTLDRCRSILTALKARHNEIVSDQPLLTAREVPLNKVHVIEKEKQKLTPREEEVLKLLAKGLTSSEIGEKLFIEETTVETHRKNLLSKFEAKNMAQLIKKASRIYWLE